ncbi:hypothetical protein HMPREF0379_1220 [[Eubacterium] yurii subsp. margaretiae ATCC 43715]|nr:hypothetical protein HMPREF0379_1220 [[Eubacterium] yurii subsp. margaretiae ATCC 43715]
MGIIKSGKLSINQLEEIIFKNLGYERDDIITRPFVGQDCGCFLGNEDIITVTSDPITATSEDMGRLAVIVNLNDIATSFATPLAITVTILAPVGTTQEEIKKLMSDISDECIKNKVQIIGGHTEVTSAVNKMIVSITAFGRIEKGKFNSISKVHSGQKIYMSKSISLEGIMIIVKEKKEELKNVLSQEEIQRAENFYDELSVAKDAYVLRNKDISFLHDVTEGGLFGAIYEMMRYCNKGCVINYNDIKINNITRKVCDYYKIDATRLISSGCMLIITDDILEEEIDGVSFTQIGVVTDEDMIFIKDGKTITITEPDSDAIYEVL